MKAKIQTNKFDPNTLIVTRDNHIDEEYYDIIYAEKRRQALHDVGERAVRVMAAPIRNFSLNMVDLVREHIPVA